MDSEVSMGKPGLIKFYCLNFRISCDFQVTETLVSSLNTVIKFKLKCRLDHQWILKAHTCKNLLFKTQSVKNMQSNFVKFGVENTHYKKKEEKKYNTFLYSVNYY